jgi:hypothetical protein
MRQLRPVRKLNSLKNLPSLGVGNINLEERLQGALLGAVLGEVGAAHSGSSWVWHPQAPGTWGQVLYQGCAYWAGRSSAIPPAQTAAEALVLVLPGLVLCYPQRERMRELVTTAQLPAVVAEWAGVLAWALQGQVGEPIADEETWPDVAVAVTDFIEGATDPSTTLTLGVKQGRSPLTLLLTGYLLGAYGGVRGFPSAWVVSRLQDTNWRAWGTELLTRWAGVRVGRFPWAVAPVVNATGVGSR